MSTSVDGTEEGAERETTAGQDIVPVPASEDGGAVKVNGEAKHDAEASGQGQGHGEEGGLIPAPTDGESDAIQPGGEAGAEARAASDGDATADGQTGDADGSRPNASNDDDAAQVRKEEDNGTEQASAGADQITSQSENSESTAKANAEVESLPPEAPEKDAAKGEQPNNNIPGVSSQSLPVPTPDALQDSEAPPTPDKTGLPTHTSTPTEPNSARSGQSSSSSSSLQPETMQHRHNAGVDKPSSYQPSLPSSFLHLKALALQVPSNSASSSGHQSSNHHIDPPTLILEGRTNLSTARRRLYSRVTRTLPELQLWILSLTLSFPAAIFSPFSYPPPTLGSGANMEDVALRSYLTTITNQFARILRKPYVLSHPATVALVDCDFSYNPSLPHVGPGSSVSARRKLDDGIALTRAGHDPLRAGRKGKAGAGSSATATWDVDGVVAALGLPSLPSSQASGDVYGGNPAPQTSSKGPLSIFSRANASPQRIQPYPSVPIPPGEEDQDEEELTAARNEITRLELQFEQASLAAQSLVERKGAMTATLHQLSAALTDLARLDEGRPVARKAKQSEDVATLTKGIEAWSSAQIGANSALTNTVIPNIAYQSVNARAAIDALLRRAAAASHRYSALVVLVQKRREAERLKRARGEIRQEDVDWVLQELRDAQRTTQVLTHHLSTFTSTLKEELKEHSRNTHLDIQESLLNHARSSIRAQKFLLSNLTRARDGLVALREGKGAEVATKTAGVEEEGTDQVSSHIDEALIVTSADGPAEDSVQANADDVQVEASEQVHASAETEESQLDQEENAASDLAGEEALASQITVQQGAVNDEADVASREGQDVPPLSVPISDTQRGTQTQAPAQPQVSEPSPWAQNAEPSPWDNSSQAQDSLPTPAEPSPWAIPSSTSPFGAVQTPGEQSAWAQESEPISAFGDVAPAISQSTFLPPPSHRSGFEDDVTADPAQTDSFVAPPRSTSMSQSAFLPGRDISRYANPFARMDGGASQSNPFASNGAASSGAQPGYASRGQSDSPYFKTASQPQDQQSPSTQSSQAPAPANKRPNDPWANRSRISASDAARSLAGRF